LPGARTQRNPLTTAASLPYQEVGRFLQAIRTYEYKKRTHKREYKLSNRPIVTHASLLHFVKYVMGRGLSALFAFVSSEVLLAEWNEFDIPKMVWTVPKEPVT
jgi:hypothetical protein